MGHNRPPEPLDDVPLTPEGSHGVEDVLGYYERLIENCRAVTRAPVVLGGSGFSVMPAKLMSRLRPDYGIEGEGERAFAQLVEKHI